MKKIAITLLILEHLVLGQCLSIDTSIVDTESNIMWSQETSSGKSWNSAVDYCASLSEHGYVNWILPNINELLTLRALQTSPTTFPRPNCPYVNNYWSATTSRDTTKAYKVTNGKITPTSKTSSTKIRCIRKVY